MGHIDEDIDISRRNLGAVLGILGGSAGLAALSACATNAVASPEPTDRATEPLTGSALSPVLTIASVLPSGSTTVDVTPQVSAALVAAIANGMLIAIEPYTANCEVVRVTSATNHFPSTLTYAPATQMQHNAGVIVAVIEDGTVTPQMFGAELIGANGGLLDVSSAVTAAANSSAAMIAFPAGSYRLSNNVTFPSGKTLQFAGGGVLQPDSKVTVTINGDIIASPTQQLFANVGPVQGPDGAVNISKPCVISVKWFGAGNGGTSDDVAINAAVAAKDAAGGGTLYFPAGNYRCAATVDFGNAPCVVRGDGWSSNGATNAGTNLSSSMSSGYAFTIGNSSASSTQIGIKVQDLAILSTVGPSGITTTGLAIRPTVPQSATALSGGVIIQNVYVGGFNVGFNPGASQGCIFRDLTVENNITGLLINGLVNGQPGGNTQGDWFYALNAQSNQFGVFIAQAAHISVFGGTIRANSQIGLCIQPGIFSGQALVRELAFHGIWFDGNNGGLNSGNGTGLGLGDIVFDASKETYSPGPPASGTAIQFESIAFHNCHSQDQGTLPFVRNLSAPNPSTYATVRFYDCCMIAVTLQLPTWSHLCTVVGSTFNQIVDNSTYAAAPAVILGSSNFPGTNGLAYAQVGAVLALANVPPPASPQSGTANALPAKPQGYLTIQINGNPQQTAQVPYY